MIKIISVVFLWCNVLGDFTTHIQPKTSSEPGGTWVRRNPSQRCHIDLYFRSDKNVQENRFISAKNDLATKYSSDAKNDNLQRVLRTRFATTNTKGDVEAFWWWMKKYITIRRDQGPTAASQKKAWFRENKIKRKDGRPWKDGKPTEDDVFKDARSGHLLLLIEMGFAIIDEDLILLTGPFGSCESHLKEQPAEIQKQLEWIQKWEEFYRWHTEFFKSRDLSVASKEVFFYRRNAAFKGVDDHIYTYKKEYLEQSGGVVTKENKSNLSDLVVDAGSHDDMNISLKSALAVIIL